ncbi:hypothetical protein ACLB1S_29520 [Escherichia coli]
MQRLPLCALSPQARGWAERDMAELWQCSGCHSRTAYPFRR